MEAISTHISSKNRLLGALFLGFSYFIILGVGSHFSESLSLKANAGHMLMHSSVLLIALIAATIAEKSPNEKFTAGYARVESLGAFINGIILLSIAIWIGAEALEHHQEVSGHDSHHDHVHEIDVSLMGGVAFVGLFLHAAAATILYKGRKESLNVHMVFLHVFLDVAITLCTLAAAVSIHFGAPEEIDRWLAVIIAAFIAFSSLKLLRASAHQLLDGLPQGIDYKEISSSLKKINHITDVHNIIIRTQGSQPALSAHLVLKSDCIHSDHWIECRKEAEALLKEKFNIHHTVLQMEVSEKHAQGCDHPSHD